MWATLTKTEQFSHGVQVFWHGYNDSVFKPKNPCKIVRRYKDISCGDYHTLIIDIYEELYACGKKDMVLSKYDEIEPISLEFFYNKKLSEMCAAEEHSIALTVGGLFCMGC